MNRNKTSSELKAAAKDHMLGHYSTAISALLLVGLLNMAINMLTATRIDRSSATGTVLYLASSFLITALLGVISAGVCYFYLKISCGQQVTVSDIFYDLRNCPEKAIAIQAWISILTCLISLPETILGIFLSRAVQGSGLNGLMTLFVTDTEISSVQSGILAQNSQLSDNAGLLFLLYSIALIISGIGTVIISLFYSQAFYLLHDFPHYTTKELLTMSRHLMKGHKGRLFYLYVSFIPLLLLSVLSLGLALLWILPYMEATMAEFFLDLMRNRKTAAA